MHIKAKSKMKISRLNKNNFYVVADFDQTLTTKNSNTTLSLFAKSGFYGQSYLDERTKNYNYYRPLELDPIITEQEKFDLVKQWQEASYQLMLKYKVRESDIQKIINMPNMLTMRDGSIEFIRDLNHNNIPLIINSAGCGNFIVELLKKYDCYCDNIFVFSNILEFQDDVIIDSISQIIHGMNKSDIKVEEKFYQKIQDKEYAIIIGDQLSDLKMSRNIPKKDVLTIGFLESNIEKLEPEFDKNFDIVLKNNEDFNDIVKILKLKR